MLEKKRGERMGETGKFAVIGGLAGLANGLFGTGGGLFLVPLLTRWAGLEEKEALATSVAVVCALSPVSAAVYGANGALQLQAAWPYLIGGAAGGLVAGRVFARVPAGLLRKAFGALLLYGGIRAVMGG